MQDRRPAALPAADCVVFGLGSTGISCIRRLLGEGRSVAVVDTRERPPGLETLKRDFPGVAAQLGGVDAGLLRGARQVVVSPGVALDHPALVAAAATGTEIIGDVELFARRAAAPVIAITGSNGKSTVTAMVTAILQTAGRDARHGANFGTPALDLLGGHEPDCYVLELSSFQLESTYTLAPAVACILNVSADHLDRHGSLAAYVAAKARILQRAAYAVLNADDATVARLPSPGATGFFTAGEPDGGTYGIRAADGEEWLAVGRDRLVRAADLRVGARHDVLNALAAMAITARMAVPRDAQIRALRAFAGLPHRCQQVAVRDGVVWYDDSKGTNTGATCAAVRGIFAQRSGVLIAGGLGKDADFSVLVPALDGRVHTAVLIGADAGRIAAAVGGVTTVRFATSMGDAVAQASKAARPGEAVLLSPACASFDMFANFGARGRAFVAAVAGLDRS